MSIDHRERVLPGDSLFSTTPRVSTRRTGLWTHCFTRNRGAVAAACVFGLIVVCVVAPIFSPDDSDEVGFGKSI